MHQQHDGPLSVSGLFTPDAATSGGLVYFCVTPLTCAWLLTFPDGKLLSRRVLWLIVPSLLWDVVRFLTVYPPEFEAYRQTGTLRAAGDVVALLLLVPWKVDHRADIYALGVVLCTKR